MLDHLGHPEWGRRVMQAIEVTVAEPRTRTADLGGTATTSAAGAAVLEALRVAEVGSGNAQGHQGA